MNADINLNPTNGQAKNKYTIKDIKVYVFMNLNKELNTHSICKLFSISSAKLSRLFKKHTGTSFKHYVEKIRMNKAMEMIISGNTIKEVMNETGYSNRATFYRAFKKAFNFPPSKFRPDY